MPKFAVAAALLGGACVLSAQEQPIPQGAVSVNMAPNSPLSVGSVMMADSRATARGGLLVLDLHMSLTLRNSSANRVNGVTLRVVAQEQAAGGKASVTYPSLNVGPGETFPVRIEMQLLRPSQAAGGPLVQVDLDGVLFQDLTFFGPDRLNSRRALTACEMEARRDRDYFKRVLAQTGKAGLQQQVLESMARQSESGGLTVAVSRAGRAVTAMAVPDHTETFAFLKFPDSPVEPLTGSAQLAGNEARATRIEVRNQSDRAVKHVEMGWIVSDSAGKQYMAGSLPSADGDPALPPGRTARLQQETVLNFSAKGRPLNVQRMVGFVNQVEFVDGRIWVPNRQNLENASLLKVVPPSEEEKRLIEIYRRRGPDALIAELNRF